jgi:hypothetical protein
MSSLMRDIYDPPPVPEQELPPTRPDGFVLTRGDLVVVTVLCVLPFAASLLAWYTEPELAIATGTAGALVILESWFTAMTYMHRRSRLVGLKVRWTIFLAALLPWVIGVGVTIASILGLFWVADHVG